MDIELNFDPEPSSSGAIYIPRNTIKGGRWTERLKQNRALKRRAKRNIESHDNSTDDGDNKVNGNLNFTESHKKGRFESSKDSHDTNEYRGAYKPPKEVSKDGKQQIVSSLFSSIEMPEVKDDREEPYERKSASNIPLSIELSKTGLIPEIGNHLVTKLGIEHPTGVQADAIPWLIDEGHRDTMIYAQTGSGKTLAFVLPIIQDLLTLNKNLVNVTDGKPLRSMGTMAIILAPTRELASQIYSVILSILSMASSSNLTLSPRALTTCLLVGGANRTHEKSRLRKGCPIIVATPGRLLDHLQTTSSFKLAGEEDHNQNLALRWLVMDECDRLMDMGFEEQIRGILHNLHQRLSTYSSRPYRTILSSATAGERVDRLAELAADGQPKVITASTTEASSSDNQTNLTLPEQLVNKYVICPAKLRFVALMALLRKLIREGKEKSAEDPGKILVFMSSTAAVDFYWHALGGLSMEPARSTEDSDSEDIKDKEPSLKKGQEMMKRCALLGDAPVYRLHGNLDMQTRLATVRNFSWSSKLSKATSRRLAAAQRPTETDSSSNEAIMFTTSVAARGLDIPNVSHVIIFDLPTEGGVAEYVHRVGRTARAGAAGDAYTFLLPSEKDWVEWAEEGVKSFGKEHVPSHMVEEDESKDETESSEDKNPKSDENLSKSNSSFELIQVGVENLLKDGFGGSDEEFEARSTDVQMAFERWVASDRVHQIDARSAFKDYIRAYATHPRIEKFIFNKKALHLGHLAKSFGMREAPGSGKHRDGTINEDAHIIKPKVKHTKTTFKDLGQTKPFTSTTPGSAASASSTSLSSEPASLGKKSQLVLAQSVLSSANSSTGKKSSKGADLDIKSKPSAQERMKKLMANLNSNTSNEYQVADSSLIKALKSEGGSGSY